MTISPCQHLKTTISSPHHYEYITILYTCLTRVSSISIFLDNYESKPGKSCILDCPQKTVTAIPLLSPLLLQLYIPYFHFTITNYTLYFHITITYNYITTKTCTCITRVSHKDLYFKKSESNGLQKTQKNFYL